MSLFSVHGSRLALEQVIASGGRSPVSVALHDNIVLVLNAGDTGVLQGFRITGKHLEPLPGSTRNLGLANSDPPLFLTSPGQASFTPDGRRLIVTEKGSDDRIDVPIDSASSGGTFFYVQTGASGTVDEFRVQSDGTLAKIGTVTGLPPGQEGIAAS